MLRATSAEPRLRVRNLTVEYPFEAGWQPVVEDVSFELRTGEILALVGESGSGKSVTAMSVMRLTPPPGRVAAGSVVVGEQDVLQMSGGELRQYRGGRVAIVFQNAMASLNPTTTVRDQIAESARIHCGLSRRAARERAAELLHTVGIPGGPQRARDYPHQFSGGMRQRVMIAMALAGDPDVLIADEVTTALDVTVQAQILDVLEGLRTGLGKSILLITHDLGVAARVADSVTVMYAGQVVESGSVAQVFQSTQMPYTSGLLRAVPRLDIAAARLEPIPGAPPEHGDLPVGCRFAQRCPFVRPVCDASAPELTVRAAGHAARCYGTESHGWLQSRSGYVEAT
jgi:oligopeptide/dipeptide ABC transporter ATP-binding protein